jgi:hypothetical protein
MLDKIDKRKLEGCDKCYKDCVICGNRQGGQGETCSNVCRLELVKKNNIEKYGVPHNWSTGHVGRDSYEQTMIERHGVAHNFCKGDLREKQNEKLKSEKGVDNVFQLEEVKAKIRKTCLEKYGCENPKSNEDIKKKALATFYERYADIRKKREDTGLYLPLECLEEKQIYYYHARLFTERNLKMFGDLINYDETLRGKKMHIDHIFSLRDGFLYRIPTWIIGSIVNLQLIPSEINTSKQADSWMTEAELMEGYDAFSKNNPDCEILKNENKKH